MNFHLVIATPLDPWLLYLQGQVCSWASSGREAMPATSYLLYYLSSASLKRNSKQVICQGSGIYQYQISYVDIWTRSREECLFWTWKYIRVWKINKDLPSTSQTEEGCWQTAKTHHKLILKYHEAADNRTSPIS